MTHDIIWISTCIDPSWMIQHSDQSGPSARGPNFARTHQTLIKSQFHIRSTITITTLSRMTLFQRKALGALLAASIISPISGAAEAPQPPSPNPSAAFTSHESTTLATKLSEAKKIPDDQPQNPPSSATISNANEAARARALLDRYYAISAEAQASNQPRSEKTPGSLNASPKEAVSVPSRKRTPAPQVFESLDANKQTGPINKRYVICGGGTAAWAAIEAILKKDPSAANNILLVTEEELLPYNRTMLSKELWHQQSDSNTSNSSQKSDKDAVEYAYRYVPQNESVSVIKGTRVVSLDVDDKTIELSNGKAIHYDKILFSTGGVPKTPAFVAKALAAPGVRDHVSVFRTLDDYERVRGAAESGNGVIVIGGGFLGTELAIALAGKTKDVSLVVAEVGVLYRVLPRYLCEFLARKIEDLGVKVVSSAVVTDAKVDKVKKSHLESKDEQSSDADSESRGNDKNETVDRVSLSLLGSREEEEISGGHVVVAAGIEPEVKLAKNAGHVWFESCLGNIGRTENDEKSSLLNRFQLKLYILPS